MKYANTKHISFPLGGMGTGCINLAGNGALNDWEIFNRPNKNTRNGCSHFAIKANCKNKTIARVLHGDTAEDAVGMPHVGLINMGFGHGAGKESLAGFPHFRSVEFEGEFPFAKLTYQDQNFPAIVRLCAFNPFIPQDAFHSSLPAAFFEWEIENITEEDISASVYTATCPDPDLIVRTGGDMRISNFLLWQSAYSELYFTDTLWPDMTPADVDAAVAEFYSRKRRYGGL